MKEFWARLNSTERRFVVGVAVVFFLVINIVWVWPHFGDWSETRGRMEGAKRQLVTFETGTNLIPELIKQRDKYMGQGQIVQEENQALDFSRLVMNQTTMFGIIPQNTSYRREAGATNSFFLEQSATMSLDTTEKQLVDFLYSVGAGSNSLIRVKVLSVQPEPQHTRLNTRLTLVASYQKKAIGSAPIAGTKPGATVQKPPTAAPSNSGKPVSGVAPNNARTTPGTGPSHVTVTSTNRPPGSTNRSLPGVPGGPSKNLTPNKK
jgi:hypothetical protein